MSEQQPSFWISTFNFLNNSSVSASLGAFLGAFTVYCFMGKNRKKEYQEKDQQEKRRLEKCFKSIFSTNFETILLYFFSNKYDEHAIHPLAIQLYTDIYFDVVMSRTNPFIDKRRYLDLIYLTWLDFMQKKNQQVNESSFPLSIEYVEKILSQLVAYYILLTNENYVINNPKLGKNINEILNGLKVLTPEELIIVRKIRGIE
jgi:hypothetical protein